MFLQVQLPYLTDVSGLFNFLKSVYSSLQILSNPLLSTIFAPNLRTSGSIASSNVIYSLIISNNTKLTSLQLPTLVSMNISIESVQFGGKCDLFNQYYGLLFNQFYLVLAIYSGKQLLIKTNLIGIMIVCTPFNVRITI